jgi:hypothetical protein
MYVWKIWKNTKFVGYIHSGSEFKAYWEAKRQFGENVLIERIGGDVSPKERRSSLPQ